MSFMLTSPPAAVLHLSLPDLIYFPGSDFYSPSHTLAWLQAAPLIEYIVSQAAADSKRKLPALHLSCQNFSAPSLPPVCYTPACFSRSLARYSILQHCLTLSILPVFISSFLSALRRASADGKETFFTSCIFTVTVTIPLCFGHQIGCSLWCYDHLVWMKKYDLVLLKHQQAISHVCFLASR